MPDQPVDCDKITRKIVRISNTELPDLGGMTQTSLWMSGRQSNKRDGKAGVSSVASCCCTTPTLNAVSGPPAGCVFAPRSPGRRSTALTVSLALGNRAGCPVGVSNRCHVGDSLRLFHAQAPELKLL